MSDNLRTRERERRDRSRESGSNGNAMGSFFWKVVDKYLIGPIKPMRDKHILGKKLDYLEGILSALPTNGEDKRQFLLRLDRLIKATTDHKACQALRRIGFGV
jgi:hypothetical protein